MKAISYEHYGERDVLHLIEVESPSPKSGDVLVRVQAASLNPLDSKIRCGELKLLAGGHFPKRPGQDFAGVVEAVGEGVSGFAVGDAVYGCVKSMSEGALAERVLVGVGTIARRPASLDPVTAAAVPVVAIAAMQSLRDNVHLNRGERVLVNGCTGGVGLFALQLGQRFGAHMTGVCSTQGVALSREFGAEEVIDYRVQPVTAIGQQYHAILELSGKLSFDEAQPLLDERGVFVDFSPTPAAIVGNAIANPFRSHKHLFALTAANPADLESLAQMIDSGELRTPPIREFGLEQFREAFELAEGGGVMGKVVVRLST